MDLSGCFALRPPAVAIRVVTLSQQCSILVVIYPCQKKTNKKKWGRGEGGVSKCLVFLTNISWHFMIWTVIVCSWPVVYFKITIKRRSLTMAHWGRLSRNSSVFVGLVPASEENNFCFLNGHWSAAGLFKIFDSLTWALFWVLESACFLTFFSYNGQCGVQIKLKL